MLLPLGMKGKVEVESFQVGKFRGQGGQDLSIRNSNSRNGSVVCEQNRVGKKMSEMRWGLCWVDPTNIEFSDDSVGGSVQDTAGAWHNYSNTEWNGGSLCFTFMTWFNSFIQPLFIQYPEYVRHCTRVVRDTQSFIPIDCRVFWEIWGDRVKWGL